MGRKQGFLRGHREHAVIISFVAVPLRPVSTCGVAFAEVVGVTEVEMDVIPAGGGRIENVRVAVGEVMVDLHKVPVGTEALGPSILDEKEPVSASGDGGGEVGGGKCRGQRIELGGVGDVHGRKGCM